MATPIVPQPRRTRGPKLLLACCCAALLAACAHDLGLMKKEETLNAYRAAIRWNAFQRAATFQSERAPRSATDHLADVRVTGYEVLGESEDKEHQTWNQTVEIRYYRTGDLVERTTRDRQAWRYDSTRAAWVLDSALPRFH